MRWSFTLKNCHNDCSHYSFPQKPFPAWGERERYIYRTMSILFSLTFQHIFHLSFTCQQHLVTVCVGLLLLYSVLPFTSDLQFYGLTCTLDDNRTFSCTCVIRLTYPTLHSERAFFSIYFCQLIVFLSLAFKIIFNCRRRFNWILSLIFLIANFKLERMKTFRQIFYGVGLFHHHIDWNNE